MTRRWWHHGAALALIVAVALAFGAVLASAATPQERGDETAAWLQSVLHVPVSPRTVVVGGLAEHNAGEATPDGVIRLAAEYAGNTPEALYVRIHELAHRPENQSCWGGVGDDGVASPERALEEGITDALARDLFPAALRHFLGRGPHVYSVNATYDREVGSVRYAVQKMTHGRKWGRAERLKLREWWQQDCTGRAAMLAAANDTGGN